MTDSERARLKETLQLILQADKQMAVVRAEMKRLEIEEQSEKDKLDLHAILQKISQHK